MRIFISSLVFLFSFLSIAAPGSKTPSPDLSGVWKVTKVESDAKIPGMDVTEGIDRLGLLEIQQIDGEMRQIKKVKKGEEYFVSRNDVFYTDGRGEKNLIPGQKQPLESKTVWSGQKLVTTYQKAWTQKEELELSADRTTLTQKTYIKTQFDKFYLLITFTKSQ